MAAEFCARNIHKKARALAESVTWDLRRETTTATTTTATTTTTTTTTLLNTN